MNNIEAFEGVVFELALKSKYTHKNSLLKKDAVGNCKG